MKNINSVLVTGCAGFIGSHLTDALLKLGYKVIGIDNFDPFYSIVLKRNNLSNAIKNKNFSFYEIDITERKQFDVVNENIDIVIHLAAKAGVLPSIKNPEVYIRTNILGTHYLLDFMKSRRIVKYIFASSSSIYGNNSAIPFVETDLVGSPISPYAFTKRSCELMNYTYYKLNGIDTLNLRLFTAYGPRQRPDLAIHRFVNQIRNGEEVTMYGDGSTARDYTYIDDIVDSFIRALDYLEMNKNIYEIINIGNCKPVELTQLLEIISCLLNKEPRIKKLPIQAGDVDITYANIDKAKKLLNYCPITRLEDGVKNFIDWYNFNNSNIASMLKI